MEQNRLVSEDVRIGAIESDAEDEEQSESGNEIQRAVQRFRMLQNKAERKATKSGDSPFKFD